MKCLLLKTLWKYKVHYEIYYNYITQNIGNTYSSITLSHPHITLKLSVLFLWINLGFMVGYFRLSLNSGEAKTAAAARY